MGQPQRGTLSWINLLCFKNYNRDVSVIHLVRCLAEFCSKYVLVQFLLDFWKLMFSGRDVGWHFFVITKDSKKVFHLLTFLFFDFLLFLSTLVARSDMGKVWQSSTACRAGLPGKALVGMGWQVVKISSAWEMHVFSSAFCLLLLIICE